jgi:hypothetical protein
MDPSGSWVALGESDVFEGWYPTLPNDSMGDANVSMTLRSPFKSPRALELANLEAIIELLPMEDRDRQWREGSDNALFLEAADEAEYWQWRHPNWYLTVVGTPPTTSPLMNLWLSKTAYRRVEDWVENFEDIERRLNGPFPIVVCGEITREALDLVLPQVSPSGHLLLRWHWDLRYDDEIIRLTEKLLPLFRKVGLFHPICGQDWWLVCYEATFVRSGVNIGEIEESPSRGWLNYCDQWAQFGEERNEIDPDPRLLCAWCVPSPLPSYENKRIVGELSDE